MVAFSKLPFLKLLIIFVITLVGPIVKLPSVIVASLFQKPLILFNISSTPLSLDLNPTLAGFIPHSCSALSKDIFLWPKSNSVSGPAPASTALISFAFNDAIPSATGPANCSSGAGAAACGAGASGAGASGAGASACGAGSTSSPPTSSSPLKSIALELRISAMSSLS